MSSRFRRVHVPASSGNLGPGYDVLGAALGVELVLEVSETGTFGIASPGLDVPLDRSNLVVQAFERLHPADGISFEVESTIPLARGMGSSASAIVAGLLAADHLFELANSREDIFALATSIEGHPDNVAAALYGGVAVCSPAAGPGTPALLAPPEGVEAILVIPREEVSTEAARAAIDPELPIADATHNIAAAADLVLGIERSDLTLIARGLADRVHQPRRRHLYPRSMELVERAESMGAIGATISGAGPTVLVWAFWQSGRKLMAELEAFAEGWAEVRRTGFSPRGARVELG